MNDPVLAEQRRVPPASRLWNVLEGDPYSYCLVPQAPAHYRLRLKTLPPRVDIYVRERIASLDDYDWWWVRRANKTDEWIEVCIREATVVKLAG